MRKLAFGLVAASFIALPAMAQAPLTFADVDSDGDGRLSYEELRVVWPDLTEEEFARADVESAGALTPEQLGALQPAAAPATAEPVPAPVEAQPGADVLPTVPGVVEGVTEPDAPALLVE